MKIKDSKTLKDSIDNIKKQIMDAEIDLTQPGVKSIANALLERKEEIGNSQGFASLRDIVKEVVGKFDTPKSREILIEVDKFDRLHKRDPRPGSRNDYWVWEKLLKYIWNIILKASGNPSPDVKEIKKEEEVKDEVDEVLKVLMALGKGHDMIMELLDDIEHLENEDKIPSELRYALEDIEAELSDLDFMGESDPVAAMKEKFEVEESYDFEEFED